MSEFQSLVSESLTLTRIGTRNRLVNLVAQRRAHWLLDHIDELILEEDHMAEAQKGNDRGFEQTDLTRRFLPVVQPYT